MEVYQKVILNKDQYENLDLDFIPDLLILFVSPLFDNPQKIVSQIRNQFSDSIITGCSTSGEIMDINVYDESIVVNAIKFESTKLKYTHVDIQEAGSSEEVGKRISQNLNTEDLKHVLIFSDGLHVNGADLVEGLTNNLNQKVSVTGGLAGDGSDFNSTFVIANGKIEDHLIVGIGLYGEQLKIGYGSKGGWDSFGIERQVTNSKENVLYELDGQPALELYKSFLGNKAKDLPGSGLLFPLSMRVSEDDLPLVRTILAIDEAEQSLTFAGNIPEGSFVRLMKANIDRLISGAEQSATTSLAIHKEEAQFALLISCVGRRLVLKQLVEEELEAVREVIGDRVAMSGFYSYGELAPFGEFTTCQLHNQTMTITTFSE